MLLSRLVEVTSSRLCLSLQQLSATPVGDHVSPGQHHVYSVCFINYSTYNHLSGKEKEMSFLWHLRAYMLCGVLFLLHSKHWQHPGARYFRTLCTLSCQRNWDRAIGEKGRAVLCCVGWWQNAPTSSSQLPQSHLFIFFLSFFFFFLLLRCRRQILNLLKKRLNIKRNKFEEKYMHKREVVSPWWHRVIVTRPAKCK